MQRSTCFSFMFLLYVGSTLCLLHSLSGCSSVSASQRTTQDPPAPVASRPTGLTPHSAAGSRAGPKWLYSIIHTHTHTYGHWEEEVLNLQVSVHRAMPLECNLPNADVVVFSQWSWVMSSVTKLYLSSASPVVMDTQHIQGEGVPSEAGEGQHHHRPDQRHLSLHAPGLPLPFPTDDATGNWELGRLWEKRTRRIRMACTLTGFFISKEII